ncbi:MAG: hypothetical protein Ta2A_26280 [Treponemataceae bacterium]|nr:MAG: hypothetical protein Ta2A_26280 [Treponemataceae bacterium]
MSRRLANTTKTCYADIVMKKSERLPNVATIGNRTKTASAWTRGAVFLCVFFVFAAGAAAKAEEWADDVFADVSSISVQQSNYGQRVKQLHWNESGVYTFTFRNSANAAAVENITVTIEPNEWLTFEPDTFTIKSIRAQTAVAKDIKISVKTGKKTFAERKIDVAFSLDTGTVTDTGNTETLTSGARIVTERVTIQPPKFFWTSIIAALCVLLIILFILIYKKLTMDEDCHS